MIEEDKKFYETAIGIAFIKYENLHATAWQKDTEESFKEYPSAKYIKMHRDRSDTARTEFLIELKKLIDNQKETE